MEEKERESEQRPAPRVKSHDVDMTQGSVFKHILLFSLPLLAGNLFQQMYNMVDTWVVGNFVSDAAFSAVGTVAPIVNMLIGSFMGLSSGAGVVISQYYGARKDDRVSDTVHTSMVLTAILTVVFTILGLTMTPLMLRLMNIPDDVFPESRAYLTIYFAGMAGLLFYNMGAAILRAVGDSRRPFYFLVVTAVLNTALDLLFVIKFHWGVRGVAYATIIAQGVSAVLTLAVLFRARSSVRLSLSRLRLHPDLLGQIVRVGIPAALQMAVTSFSNVIVQSYIFGAAPGSTGGWTAYSKVDQLIFLPMQSIALAATTFVRQNLGSGQRHRAKQGVRVSLAMAMAVTVVVSAVVILTAPQVVTFFIDQDKSPEVVEYGALFLRQLTPFYVLCCVNQIYAGALRGAGDSKAPMFIMLGSFVVFRQIYLFIAARLTHNALMPLAMGYPAGWLVCSVLTLLYYRVRGLGHRSFAEEHAKKTAAG